MPYLGQMIRKYTGIVNNYAKKISRHRTYLPGGYKDGCLGDDD